MEEMKGLKMEKFFLSWLEMRIKEKKWKILGLTTKYL
jgi:flagellar biosynthesis chaperone FliJ